MRAWSDALQIDMISLLSLLAITLKHFSAVTARSEACLQQTAHHARNLAALHGYG